MKQKICKMLLKSSQENHFDDWHVLCIIVWMIEDYYLALVYKSKIKKSFFSLKYNTFERNTDSKMLSVNVSIILLFLKIILCTSTTLPFL